MAGCGCGTGPIGNNTKVIYTVTDEEGRKYSYSSEVEAASAAERLHGTYKRTV